MDDFIADRTREYDGGGLEAPAERDVHAQHRFILGKVIFIGE